MHVISANATGLPSAKRGDEARPSAPVIPHPRLVEMLANRKLRKKVERLVARLIDVLDHIEVDPDLEDDDTEQDTADAELSLGARPLMDQRKGWRDRTSDLDCEREAAHA